MSRRLRVLSAGTLVSIEQPLTVVLSIVSEDLKAQPVHDIPLTHAQAITLARQLLGAIEHVDAMNAETTRLRARGVNVRTTSTRSATAGTRSLTEPTAPPATSTRRTTPTSTGRQEAAPAGVAVARRTQSVTQGASPHDYRARNPSRPDPLR